MSNRKGIVLAGGTGSRLFPVTMGSSKQLLPVYDKPMIYYPLSVLMLSKIEEILIISTPLDIPMYKKLLGDGSQFGIKLFYAVQEKPKGISEAFIIGEDFIGNSNVALILGDNLFYGQHFTGRLLEASSQREGATIFGFKVKNPNQFGVVGFDENKKVVSIEEKPENPKSNYAVTGLYFYDRNVVSYAKTLKPSKRGELEITDLNKIYLKNDNLKVELLGRGFSWLDTGNYDALLEASNFVQNIQNSHGFMIACLEEIAFNNRWIGKKEILSAIQFYGKCDYSNYLKKLIS